MLNTQASVGVAPPTNPTISDGIGGGAGDDNLLRANNGESPMNKRRDEEETRTDGSSPPPRAVLRLEVPSEPILEPEGGKWRGRGARSFERIPISCEENVPLAKD